MNEATSMREEAEALAIRALGFVAGDPELLPRFLAITGIEAGSIREAAREPGFLAGVLHFILAHEPTLLRFCGKPGPRRPASAGRCGRFPRATTPTSIRHERRSETLRQIEELASDDRPLLVLDVDDVVLEFIKPFPRFLERRGLRLTLKSFHLTGNIAEAASGRLVEQPEVTALLDEFFETQAEWQSITIGAPRRFPRSAGTPRSYC